MDNEINLVTTQRIALLENLSILQTRRGEELLIENARNEAAALDAEMNKQKKELLKVMLILILIIIIIIIINSDKTRRLERYRKR